jgi:hypothetical protein
MVRIFPKAAGPAKNSTLKGALIPPSTPPRERSVIMGNKDIVVRSNIKQPSLGRYPIKFVFTTPSQSEGIQLIKVRGKKNHLPIISHSEKINIP